ncbi:MAG: Peptidoglycan D,D-transpeptidase MrdA [Pseudomonadales bacterium]|nr:Peptidoglycan D,D-transpeptidase MrdA [Pseudomonadales bacterium]
MAERLAIKDTLTEMRIFSKRVVAAGAAVLLLAALLLGRYFQLQIVEHEQYRTASDRNRIHARAVPPRRGLIFDRAGTVLADNRPTFNLVVTRERSGDLDAMLAEVRSAITVSADDEQRFRRQLARQLPFEAVPLRFDLGAEEIARLAVNRHLLPGVEVEAELVRHYPFGDLLAHAVGYVGRINEQELAGIDRVDYSGTHLIGKNGIEKFYEDLLHGSVGYENVETDARGRALRVLDHTDPVRGADLTLSLDLRVQRVAYEALGAELGAVVAIDPRDGSVIAIASAPSFDPNPFVSGIGVADYARLRDSPDRPLLNRTMQGQYPPGSTLKPMYALAGLHYGINTPERTVRDPGWYRLNGQGRRYRDWKKWGHGWAVDLHTAVEQSCDVYFYDLAHRLGIQRLHDFSVRFGFGAPTGVDQTSERSGVMPSDAWKRKALGQPWYPGETLSAGIGQGYVLATPMQLAQMTATLANRGRLYRPRLLAAIDGKPVEPELLGTVEVADPAYWDVVQRSMEAVVHSPRGTAKIIAPGIGYRVAGKTGTAQVVGIAQNATYNAAALAKTQRDHALFVAFAPAEDPRIAVAVIVENGEHGSSTAAPVARKVMDAYLLPPAPPVAPPAPEPTPPADVPPAPEPTPPADAPPAPNTLALRTAGED